jgi:large conductance mechanosensitive channel
MGAAFGQLVESAVANIVRPLLSPVLGGGMYTGTGALNLKFLLLGNFISSVITFAITAAAVFFLIVKPLNALFGEKKKEDPNVPLVPPATLEDVVAELKALRAELARGGAAPMNLGKPATPPPPAAHPPTLPTTPLL